MDKNENQMTPPLQSLDKETKPQFKHKVLAIINFVMGMFYIFFPLVTIFFVLPKMKAVYESFAVKQPNFLTTYFLSLALVTFGIINIFVGLKLLAKSTVNREKYFKVGVILAVVTFFLVSISQAFTISSVISPMYNLVGTIDQNAPPVTPAPSPTPTPDPTANWKIYTDIKYNFSFEYPSKLGTDGFFHNSDYSYESTNFYESGPGVIANSITVNIYAREFKKNDALRDVKYLIEERQDAEKMLNLKIGEAFEKNCYIYHRRSDIVINGINTAIYESSSGSKPCREATWYAYTKKAIIQRGDILIVFTVAPYTQKQDDKLLTYFNQILSTFKFLDQEQAINNSKSCLQDSDCELRACTGCFNKEWLKTAPPDLPCMVYADYSCQCTGNKCLEIK